MAKKLLKKNKKLTKKTVVAAREKMKRIKVKKNISQKKNRFLPTKTLNRVRKKRIFRAAPKKNIHQEESELPESFFKAKIKVIGIGGGGGSIVSDMGRSLHKATFVV